MYLTLITLLLVSPGEYPSELENKKDYGEIAY
jgi:hypothetical protein